METTVQKSREELLVESERLRGETVSLRSERDRLRRENKLLIHYAYGYGNANHECEYGYPQHPEYICGLCGHDNSYDEPCPKVLTKG
jgi:hypothetical protein